MIGNLTQTYTTTAYGNNGPGYYGGITTSATFVQVWPTANLSQTRISYDSGYVTPSVSDRMRRALRQSLTAREDWAWLAKHRHHLGHVPALLRIASLPERLRPKTRAFASCRPRVRAIVIRQCRPVRSRPGRSSRRTRRTRQTRRTL